NGQDSRPLAETFDLKPAIVGWSKSGESVLISEVRRTINHLSSLPLDGAPEVDLSPANFAVAQPTLNVLRTHVGFVSETPERAPEVFVTPSAAFQPRQVGSVQDLPSVPLGKTSVVRWKSTDGREIEGLLTMPVGFQTGEKVPLLVLVHGGPT